jgi:hypothetical protein
MGLFKKVEKWADAGEDWGLLKNGVAGTAVITAAKKTSRRTAGEGSGAAQYVYEMKLRVTIPGHDPYDAEHKQWTFDSDPPHEGKVVNVKVNPDDPLDLVVDWRNRPHVPETTGKSIAEILATGVPGRAVVRQLDTTNAVAPDNGDPVMLFILDVTVDGRDPYELKLFHRVPAKDQPRVAVGQEVPIKALPPDPNEIAIDWANAF